MIDDLTATLRRYFGFESFRPGQGEAIQSVLAGQNTLVVMPTGAGKSLVYQLSALQRPGVTLVISPLIALMKDQVDSLTRRNIPSTYINSTLSGDEQAQRLQSLANGTASLVYVAPERLRSVSFQQALHRVRVGLLAVDEAHCISQWGHDFRPDYLHIAAARAAMGDPVTVALTATATPQVQDDIVKQLGLSAARRIVTGFNRPNLALAVRSTADDAAKLHELQTLLSDLLDGAAIIYAGTRRSAEEVADFIRSVGLADTQYYHAGLDPETRSRVQESFIAGDLPVVVATNAFGMGIDRADVRMVIHYDLPGTLEAYYQEAGRAGRDGEPARAVLLYSPRDRALQEFFIENDTPAVGELRTLFEALRSPAATWISRDDLSLASGLPEVKIRVGLAQLEAAGVVEHLGDDGLRMLLRRGAWNEAAARMQDASAEARRQRRREQLAAMIAYAESNFCRRRIILNHFGDGGPADAPVCCDNCQARGTAAAQTTSGDVASMSHAERAALIILDTVRRLQWGVGRKKLAQTLTGSHARAMKASGYENSVYYGRLAVFKVREMEGLISQMVSMGYLKVIGSEQPVLRLTPQGEASLKARAAIPLRLPRPVQQQEVTLKKAQREAGSTAGLSIQMLGQGQTPAQIAAQRMKSEDTIYNHLAQGIAQGTVSLEAILAGDVIASVRAAIAVVGSVERLAPLKMILPTSVSYGQIRCVTEAWKREQGIAPDQAETPAEERVQRVVELGNAGKPDALPELIAALSDPDGNVRRLAASALGKIGDRKAVDPLVDLLQHEVKPQVRQYAVKALGSLADERACPLLEWIADNQNEREYTRLSARSALQRLSSPGTFERTDDDAVAAFLSRAHPRPLAGPWQEGWALGFHSGFGGADWKRSGVGDLTYRLKYESDAAAVPPLVEQAVALCHEHPALAAVDALVPVPPSMTRDLDPVGAFSNALAAGLRKPVLHALAKTRPTSPQKDKRTLAQKRDNVAGAFAASPDVRGKRLLVLDDLYDSGATLEEVTRVLRQAGAASVCVLTLTRTIHSDR